MGIFSSFKKKNGDPQPANMPKNASKEDIFRMIMEQQSQKSPSDHFASGAVFDICRQQRDAFYTSARSNDAVSLLRLFVNSYSLFLDNPQVVGFMPDMVNRNNNDTNPATWNANVINLQPGDYAVLLFMPIQDNTLAARIVGIVFGNKGDGYYYCMLNKGEENASDVIRNNGMFGLVTVGTARGLGLDLMNSFLNCVDQDYYRNI